MKSRRSVRSLIDVGVLCLALAGCTAVAPDGGATSGPSTSAARPTVTAVPPPTSPSGIATRPPSTSGPVSDVTQCVDRTYDQLTAPQRIGQLIMVGMLAGDQTAVHRLISDDHVGNVVYLGGWIGSSRIAAISDELQHLATPQATGAVGLFLAADQEGGEVQQLTGAGFSTLPSALRQGAMPASEQQNLAATIGRQLQAAGVRVDLAPVADTVPASLGTANGPIGRFYREYGNTPAVVSQAVFNVVRGLTGTGEIATLKHFPGLGRIANNTDTSATGITDDTMTAHDPYLQPFAAGIKAGAAMVMVGFGRYPKIDPTRQAAFSPTIIEMILRRQLAFHGVVISDSLSATAVQQIPVGSRAVQFLAAGGDIALTAASADVPRMESAIGDRAASDPTFARQVDVAAHLVLTLKAQAGVLSCG